MSESKKRLIKQMINGIDEKYTDGTAERLYRKMGSITEMTEIIVKKQPEKKRSRLSRFISIALPTAAAIAIVIGAGFFISRIPIEPKNTGTSTSYSDPDPSGTTAVGTGGDYALYEDIGYASFDYYVVKLKADKSGNDNDMTLAVGFKNPSDPEGPFCSTGYKTTSVGDTGSTIKGYRLRDGDVVALFRPYENDEGNIEYILDLYRTKPEWIQKMNMKFMMFSKYPFIQCDESANSFILNDTAHMEPQTYYIDFVNNTVTDEPVSDMPEYFDKVIYDSELDYADGGLDLGLFEETFYGKWINVKSDDVLNLTYNGSYSDSGLRNIAVIDEGTIISGISGGMPVFLFKPNDEERLYYYNMDLGSRLEYSEEKDCYSFSLKDYCTVYKRMTGDKYLGERLKRTLTGLGLRKLMDITGADIMLKPQEIVDSSGKQWNQIWHPMFGSGEYYLIKYDDDQIRYSARYAPYEMDDELYESDNMEEIGFRYLSFTLDKVNGEWQITSVDEFDPSIEKASEYPCVMSYLPTSDGHYYALCYREDDPYSAEYYYWNGMKYEQLDLNGSYWNYSAGHWVNVSRSFVPVRVQTVYDGYLFVLLQDTEVGNYYVSAYEGGKLCSAFADRIFEEGSNTQDIQKTLTVSKIGVLLAVTVECTGSNGTYSGTAIFDPVPINYSVNHEKFLPLFDVSLDDDGKGFTADYRYTYTPRGEHTVQTVSENIHYRCDRNVRLSEAIKLLEIESDYIWKFCRISTEVSESDDFIRDLQGSYYYYVCSRKELDNYLSGIYTDSETLKIMNSSFKTANGNLYAEPAARGGNADVGEVVREIESEDENSAVIRYTAYEWDYEANDVSDNVLKTYVIQAVNTDNGWRLCDFYSIY